jgi:hypothetical protein
VRVEVLDVQDVITQVSVFIAATGVIIAVVYYFFDVRNQSKIRKSDMFMRVFATSNNDEFQSADMLLQYANFTDYADFEKQYGPFSTIKPIHRAIRVISVFFEALGLLLYRKLIDEQMLWDSYQIEHRWEKVKPIIEHLREELNEPRYMEWFEYLYNWFKAQEKQGKVRQQPIYQV